MRGFWVAVLILCLPGLAFSAREEQRLKELGEKVKTVDARRRDVERGLRAIDARSTAIRRDMEQGQVAIEARRQRLQQYRATILSSEAALTDTRRLFKGKVVGLYKGAAGDMIDLWFSHAELGGYLEAAVARDRAAMEHYIRVSRAKKAAQKGLEVQTKALRQDLSRLSSRAQDLETEKQKKKLLLASLQQESRAYQNEIDRLMASIRARQKAKVTAYTGIARQKGQLPWPAKGQIVRRFGKYTEEGVVQISQGLDIQTEETTPVRSIYRGTIVHQGWIDRYGYTLIVDHGGGYYSIYGHVGKVLKKQGENVGAQEVIAQAGQSGEAVAPTLHFEIRFHGKAQDPLAWLKR